MNKRRIVWSVFKKYKNDRLWKSTNWLCLWFYTYVESWLNEAQQKRSPKSPGPLGPVSSPGSIPISSNLLPTLRPALEVWDRLLFFARCRRKTVSIREKCGPGPCSEQGRRFPPQEERSSDSVRVFRRGGRRPLKWRKRWENRSKTRTADRDASQMDLVIGWIG